MGGTVNVAEPLATHLSVDLCGGEIRMTEQFLHRTEIGTAVEKMSGEGVTKGMRVGRCDGSAIEQSAHVPR